MEEMDLQQVLSECVNSAKIGYKIASEQEKNLAKTLSLARDNVQSTILEFNSSPCYVPEAANLLELQLGEISEAFNQLSFSFKENLQDLRENLTKFSITLFGRTMAGKSTLMEVLTEGDGKSIGKGAQRTTRDIRKYTWNGLEITDVPGIGAFDGEEDELLAFDEANKADLILFLITDDAPQAAEAECFSRIVGLGKPIICIMNVKVSIEGKSLPLALRDIRKRFDINRLNQIQNQFKEFSKQFGQTWDHIPFVYAHLQAAFAALKADDPMKSECLHDKSRIDVLKRRIVEQVRTKGEFYRIKTFIDIISNPILESMENLLEQSQVNSAQGRTILAKKRQLADWKKRFERDGKKQIESLVETIRSELDGEIASFAEEHFDDKNVNKAWKELLENRKDAERGQELLKNLEEKCNDELNEISRAITKELQYVVSIKNNISLRTHNIIDGKKFLDWSVLVVDVTLWISKEIALLVGATSLGGVLGWATLAVGVIGIVGSFFGSFLFKSRDKKEQEARARLEKELSENVDKYCDTIKEQLEQNLNSMISNRITPVITDLKKLNTVIFSLADTQKELAWELNRHLMELNKNILTEAIRLIGAEGLQYHVQSVARIPGNTVLILPNSGSVFPEAQENDLYKLMTERIWFAEESDNKKVFISKALRIDKNKISIEEEIGVAHIHLGSASPNMKIKERLTQQLSGLLITNG